MQAHDAFAMAAAGKAVVLLGAGFSLKAENAAKEALPRGSDLAKDLLKEIGAEEDTDFGLAAQLFNKVHGGDTKPLHAYLLKKLKVADVKKYHEDFAKIPWRRIYTTNFDDAIEVGFERTGGGFLALTPRISPREASRSATWIVHLHGFVRELTDKGAAYPFDLAKSTYVDPALLKTGWPSQLQTDIEAARAVFIVGYSLNDFHIAKLLKTTSQNKRKTFVILHDAASDALKSYAEDYGTVLKIGIEGLVREIEKIPSAAVDDADASLLAFTEYLVPSESISPSVDDIAALLLSGTFDDKLYLYSNISKGRPYAFHRNVATRALQWGGEARKMLVHSGIGNGKTVFLRQIALELAQSGHRVFFGKYVSDLAYQDLEKIRSFSGPKAFLFDGIREYEGIIRDVAQNMGASDVLVVAARPTAFGSEFFNLHHVLGDGFVRSNLDRLTSAEVGDLDELMNFYGLWGGMAGKSVSARRAFIRDSCGDELRSVVLYCFKSSTLGERIREPIKALRAAGAQFEEALAALLMCRMADCPLDFFDVCQLIDVDVEAVRNAFRDAGVEQFFPESDDGYWMRSSVLAQFALSTLVPPDVCLAALTKVTERLVEYEIADWRYEESLPKLLRFAVITRIFDGADRREFIGRLYEGLLNIRRLREDPQFWLQFAMARMEERKYSLAEKCLDTAYALAGKMYKYKTYMLDNQYARWLLLSRVESDEYTDIDAAVVSASEIIVGKIRQIADDLDVYVLRLAHPLVRFRKQFERQLSPEGRQALASAVAAIVEKLKDVQRRFGLNEEEESVLRLLGR